MFLVFVELIHIHESKRALPDVSRLTLSCFKSHHTRAGTFCEQTPSDVQCDMWQEGSPVHIEHHLICEISLVPYLQHLSGHVLTINYSSERMKWAAEKEAAMPDSSWNVSSRDRAFNVSDVWAAHTVYLTACSLAPLKATAALSFKPLLKLDWSNFFGHFSS